MPLSAEQTRTLLTLGLLAGAGAGVSALGYRAATGKKPGWKAGLAGAAAGLGVGAAVDPAARAFILTQLAKLKRKNAPPVGAPERERPATPVTEVPPSPPAGETGPAAKPAAALPEQFAGEPPDGPVIIPDIPSARGNMRTNPNWRTEPKYQTEYPVSSLVPGMTIAGALPLSREVAMAARTEGALGLASVPSSLTPRAALRWVVRHPDVKTALRLSSQAGKMSDAAALPLYGLANIYQGLGQMYTDPRTGELSSDLMSNLQGNAQYADRYYENSGSAAANAAMNPFEAINVARGRAEEIGVRGHQNTVDAQLEDTLALARRMHDMAVKSVKDAQAEPVAQSPEAGYANAGLLETPKVDYSKVIDRERPEFKATPLPWWARGNLLTRILGAPEIGRKIKEARPAPIPDRDVSYQDRYANYMSGRPVGQ